MRIAMVGSGSIGGGLGRAWSAKGHTVSYAARDVTDPDVVALARETGARVATIEEALADAEVIALAMPFGAAATVARALPAWDGRIVIDCTNPIGPGFTLLHGHTDSGAEAIARLMPGARVVRALIEEVGFEPIDVGPLTSARYLEPMTVLWITASRSLGRQFAFKVLR